MLSNIMFRAIIKGLLIGFIVLFLYAIIVNNVFAYELIADDIPYDGTVNSYSDDFRQSFIASTTNLSAVEFIPKTTYTNDAYFVLCKGDVTAGTCYNGGDWCMATSTNELIKLIYAPSESFTADVPYKLEYDSINLPELTIGEEYFFCFEDDGAQPTHFFQAYHTTTYPGESNLGANIDVDLKFYYNNSYGYDNYWTYDNPQDITGTFQNFSHVSGQTCLIGEQCNLWFSFTDDYVGSEVYLVPDEQNYQNPNYAVSSTTIIDILGNQNAVVLPSYNEEIDLSYCFYVDYLASSTQDILSCSINIHWVASSTFFQQLFDEHTLSIFENEDVCSDLQAPTSTSAFLSAVSSEWWMYNIQCSARKIGHFFFTPDVDSVQKTANQFFALKDEFPFSIYNQIYTATYNNNTSTSSISIPLYAYDMNGTKHDMGNLFDADDFSNSGFGNYWQTFIIPKIKIFMYIMLCLYFAWRVFKKSYAT